MHNRDGDVLLKERAGDGGGTIELAGKANSGGSDVGEVRAALGDERRSNETGGDGRSTVGDPESGEVGVAGVYGTLEVR